MTSQYDWFQAMAAGQFDPGTLTVNWQPVFVNGFPENINVMHVYNGGAVSIDVSFNGADLHAVWPPGGTLVIDLQANDNSQPSYGMGTLQGRKGQNVWVRTSVNPTWLTIGGFR